MTARYELLIEAINKSNDFILTMFLFALALVLGWHALNWVTPFLRRPLRVLYIASLIGMYFFVTVFLGQ